jgi:L-ascorbate metabolism protein UlaG (beta-lactamase superfamily)
MPVSAEPAPLSSEAAPASREAVLCFRWLGTQGIELRLGSHVLLLDPFLTRPPLRRLYVGRVAPDAALLARHLPRADDILVAHAHYDHLLDVPEIARRTGAHVYGTPNTCRLCGALGVAGEQVHPIAAGDRLTAGPFAVQVLAAVHPPLPPWPRFNGALPDRLRAPLRLSDYRMDGCLSYLITAAGYRLLFAPSAVPDGGAPVDIVFLSEAGLGARALPLLRELRPALVVPVHWDDHFRPLAATLRPLRVPTGRLLPPLRRLDPQAFAARVAQELPGTRVLVPEPMRSYRLPKLNPRS